MDAGKLSPDIGSSTATSNAEAAQAVVFQPQKLKEIVEVVDLMGTVASRVREDSSGDLGGGGGGASGGQQGQGATGTSARDEAIAKAPPVPVMQQKLVEHLRREVTTIEKQAARLRRSSARGSAWALNDLYRKIRRLSALIGEILQASAEMVKRFYISVFIDRQPLVVTGGSIVRSEE